MRRFQDLQDLHKQVKKTSYSLPDPVSILINSVPEPGCGGGRIRRRRRGRILTAEGGGEGEGAGEGEEEEEEEPPTEGATGGLQTFLTKHILFKLAYLKKPASASGRTFVRDPR